MKKEEEEEEAGNGNSAKGERPRFFYRKASRKCMQSCSTVLVQLEPEASGPGKKVTFGRDPGFPDEEEGIPGKKEMIITLPGKSVKMVAKAVQTDYRESETQTVPWRHDIRAEKKFLEDLLALDSFDLVENFPPSLEDLMEIEAARQRRAWESIVAGLKGPETNGKKLRVLGWIAEAEAAAKERKMAEKNEERLDKSRKLMMEERKEREDKLARRLQRSYAAGRKENDGKIYYWNHQLSRKLRKMKLKRMNLVQRTRGENALSYILKITKLSGADNSGLHREIMETRNRYLNRFQSLLAVERLLPSVLRAKTTGFNYEEAAKPKPFRLCLRKLHRDEGKKGVETGRVLEPVSPLRVPIVAETRPETPPPSVERPSSADERLEQASLLLQTILKGRAIQTKKLLEFLNMAAGKSN